VFSFDWSRDDGWEVAGGWFVAVRMLSENIAEDAFFVVRNNV